MDRRQFLSSAKAIAAGAGASAAFAAAGLALGYYLKHLNRFLRR